jgi:hypothetical protein
MGCSAWDDDDDDDDVVSKICIDIPCAFSSVFIHCRCSLCPLVDRRLTAIAAICITFTGVRDGALKSATLFAPVMCFTISVMGTLFFISYKY